MSIESQTNDCQNDTDRVVFKQIKYNNGDTYEGECSVTTGARHGEGLYTYASGETFEGMYADDNRVQGKMTYLDGSTYQGEWLTIIIDSKGEGVTEFHYEKEGRCDSPECYSDYAGVEAGAETISPKGRGAKRGWNLLSLPSSGNKKKKKQQQQQQRQEGIRYVMRDGTGEYVYPSGDKYSGQWKRNKKDGSGYFFQKETGACYSGQWRDGEINGHGRWTLADGSAFEGNFVQGIPVGEGAYIPSDGGCMLMGTYSDGCEFVPGSNNNNNCDDNDDDEGEKDAMIEGGEEGSGDVNDGSNNGKCNNGASMIPGPQLPGGYDDDGMPPPLSTDTFSTSSAVSSSSSSSSSSRSTEN